MGQMGFYTTLTYLMMILNTNLKDSVFPSQSVNSCLPDVSNVDCDSLADIVYNVSAGDRSNFAPVVDFDTSTHDLHDHDFDNARQTPRYDLRSRHAPRVTTGWSQKK